AAGAGIAALTGGGRLSPDVDQYRTWRRLAAVIPEEQFGRPWLEHRWITHWVGWPIIGAGVIAGICPSAAAWAAWAAVAGWVTHLVLGAVFGGPGYGRGPGVPLTPVGPHVGLGLASGGAVEYVIGWPVLIGMAGWFVLRGSGYSPAQLGAAVTAV